MRKLVTLITFLALIGAASLALAQDEAPAGPPGSALLDGWVGSWTAEGSVLGMSESSTLTWAWDLGNWWLHGEQAATYTMEDGTVVNATQHFFLKPNGDGTYDGYWIESGGRHWAWAATEVEGNIVLAWTNELGSFTFTAALDGDTVIGTMMMQGEDGSWNPAGLVTYTRTGG